MDPHNSASGTNAEPEDPTSGLTTQPFPFFVLKSLTEPESMVSIGRFQFNETQLDYVWLSTKSAGGGYTAKEVIMVLRYKWPDDFRTLQEEDLEELVWQEWRHNSRTINPEDKPLRVNTFRIELREAEVKHARARVREFKIEIVIGVVVCKLFSDLSSVDIALGMTSHYSGIFKGYRYVWTTSFKATDVEYIWYRSRHAFKNEPGKRAGKESLRKFLRYFTKRVEGGRADEMSVVDPRSYGNQESAINLVGETMDLIKTSATIKIHSEYLLRREQYKAQSDVP